jgi:hypothetical protein
MEETMAESRATDQATDEELPAWCVIEVATFSNDQELLSAPRAFEEQRIIGWAVESVRSEVPDANERAAEEPAGPAPDASAGGARQATLSNPQGQTREVVEPCVYLAGFDADAVVRSNTAIVLFLTPDCTAGPAHAIIPATGVRTGLGPWSGRAMSARFIKPGDVLPPP